MRFSSRVSELVHSPIGAAHALVPQRTNDRPLLDLSQAAPSFPAADVVVDRIAEVAASPDGGRYAPQPGIPALREAFAAELDEHYPGSIGAQNVLITAGCNQAFCIVASALSGPGDEAIVVAPYYFNHDMWLDVEGVTVRHLEPGPDLQPDPDALEALIGPRTTMVVLVSPGNPSGVTVAPDTIRRIANITRRHGAALLLDETYRMFRDRPGAAHDLYADPDWGDHVVTLHSFSKDFAIPGYRVGAVVAGQPVVAEALKVLDCIAISAPRVSQEAALAGLTHALDWRADQIERIRDLEQQFVGAMTARPGGFELITSGAYFGWIRHPHTDQPTGDIVRRLVLDHDVLVIPGTAFTTSDQSTLRMSFANLTPSEIRELPGRLAELA